MKVDKSQFILVALAAVVVAIVVWRRNPPHDERGTSGGVQTERQSPGGGSARSSNAGARPGNEGPRNVEESAADSDDGTSEAQPSDSSPDPADAERALVEEFDNATDKWTNPVSGEISTKEVYAFADAFSRVPAKYKRESLQRALNLIPDDNIMILAGLLMDKSQEKEYIMAVFQDVLNRSDEVKQPLLNEIYKDKTHPCWPEVAWIFDATGQKDNKNTK